MLHEGCNHTDCYRGVCVCCVLAITKTGEAVEDNWHMDVCFCQHAYQLVCIIVSFMITIYMYVWHERMAPEREFVAIET